MQMIALGVLLAGPAGDKIVPGVTWTGLVMLWVAALLTLWTGYDYLKAAVRTAMEPRWARTPMSREDSAISPGCARRPARPRRYVDLPARRRDRCRAGDLAEAAAGPSTPRPSRAPR